MLFPSKHSHPDQTVVAVSTVMIRYLRRRQVVSFDDLLQHCRKRVAEVEYLFAPALSLLFLLGIVEYLPKVDSFRMVRSTS
jgi:hypothetical protein